MTQHNDDVARSERSRSGMTSRFEEGREEESRLLKRFAKSLLPICGVDVDVAPLGEQRVNPVLQALSASDDDVANARVRNTISKEYNFMLKSECVSERMVNREF